MIRLQPYYQIISCFFFALLGVMIKKSLDDHSIENIVFFRSFFGSLIVLFFILSTKKKISSFLPTQNFSVHLFRCIFGVSAMYFGYKSLLYLTLAQASTIGFTKVFFTCLVSSFVFSEKLNLKTCFLILSGFLGIMLITNPDQVDDQKGLYMALFSSICVSGGIISISYLSKREETSKILFYHSVMSSIIFFLIFKDKISIEWSVLFLDYLFITLAALLGQYFNTESYKNSETKNVVILSYTRIIFSAIFGFLFFNEQISLINLLGILVIVITSFIIQKT